MRPIYHQVAHRLRAHIFVTALALLMQWWLEPRLPESRGDISAQRAMEALETVRLVSLRGPRGHSRLKHDVMTLVS